MSGYSVELGPMQSSSSVWRQAAVAVAGGAVAGVLLATLAPAQQVYNYAPSTAANAVKTAPLLNSARPVSSSAFVSEQPATEEDYSVYQLAAPSWQTQSLAPLLLAASGVLMVIAAAIRFFRPAQPTEYAMLLTTARTQREMAAMQKEEAKRREIQERLMRLARMGALPSHVSTPAASAPLSTPAAAPVTFTSGNEWESRQQKRERQEREQEEAKRREIQERLSRLASMGFTAPTPAPVSAAPAAPKSYQPQAAAPAPVAASLGSISDWERRQQERERREREQEAAKQREIQERLARLAKLGAAPVAAVQAAPAAAATANEWEVRQQERERREREKAMAAQREIEERMARLARLSSGH